MAAAVALILYFGGFSAAGQTAMRSGQPAKSLGNGPPHAYLLRGLMNIFSLGMDELAQKIERAGIASTIHEHGDWQRLSDEIAAKYKSGNHGPTILIGHSLGADAVMLMGERLHTKGVPVALIVPFDATRSLAASANVARVMNITQRDYAYMMRGYGFHGELQNIDVSRDESVGHINIDKSARLHAMVVNKIVSVVGKGGGKGQATIPPVPPSSKPDSTAPELSPLAPRPVAGGSAKLESAPSTIAPPLSATPPAAGSISNVSSVTRELAPALPGPAASAAAGATIFSEYEKLAP